MPSGRSTVLSWLLRALAGVAMCAVLAGAGGLAWYMAFGKPGVPPYKQETPDDVINAAVTMVKAGRADKLPTLVYADSLEMRAVLVRLGGLTGSLQDLSGEVTRRFPTEVARYKKESQQAIESGAATAAAARVLSGGRAGGVSVAIGSAGVEARKKEAGDGEIGRRGRPDPQIMFEQAALRIFADPFGWLETGAARLTTEIVADDRAAVMFDGAAVGGIGLTMRKVEGKWFIELPLNAAIINRYTPQTRNEWAIVANLIKVLDNAVKDLAVEVKAGRVQRIEQLAEKAGEMAFPPAAMVAIVYAKEMDVRGRREKSMSDFRKRLTTWGKARVESGADQNVTTRLSEAVTGVAVEEIDKIIRSDTAVVKGDGARALPKFEPMTAITFEALIEGWLMNRGVKISLAAPPAEPELGRALEKLAPKVALNRR